MEKRILRLMLIALGFILLLVVGLSILFSIALNKAQNTAQDRRTADIVAAIRSIRVIKGADGTNAISIPGHDGKDGQNATSTIIVQQVPIKGDKGDDGKSAPPTRQIEFDGMGQWRYENDEEWKPLFKSDNLQKTSDQ